MMPRELPARPNLEQLKKQAKSLLHAAQARDRDALHRAAMGGHPAAVRVLLQCGANVNAMDGMFSASPLVWAVEGRRTSKHGGTDHVEVARLLIAAGCPVGWTPPEGAPSAEGTLEGLEELRKAAEQR